MTNFELLTIFSSSELREDEVCGGREREPGEGRVGRHRLREETHQVRLPVQPHQLERGLRQVLAGSSLRHARNHVYQHSRGMHQTLQV